MLLKLRKTAMKMFRTSARQLTIVFIFASIAFTAFMLFTTVTDHQKRSEYDGYADEESNTSHRINNPNLCLDSNPTLLILVVSAPNNFEARLAIRRTWGTVNDRPGVQVAFVLGQKSNVQERLIEENSTFGDLIQGPFIDDYSNLTRKSIFILKWAQKNCPHARFLAKIDDDCFLRPDNLLKYLEKRHETSAIYGRVWKNVKPIRSKKNKWSVARKKYKPRRYPWYTGGPSYVITFGEAIAKLIKTIGSDEVKWLELEDVFITGICAQKANIERINCDKFCLNVYPSMTTTASDSITYHGVSPDLMYKLWSRINTSSTPDEEQILLTTKLN